MAITIKGQPGVGNLFPVYNPLWYYVDSTNKSKDGFRYIVDLYDFGTSIKTRYNPPPRPGDGYGQIDVSSIIQCRMGYDANVGGQTAISAINSYFRYDIKFGEEYLAAFTYTGYSELTGSGTPFDGKVRLDGVATHAFVVGDQIEIEQTDGGAAVPALQSLFTVVNVPSSTSVVVDLNYYLIDGLPAMGGTIYYSDRRKIQIPDLATISGTTAYNGALDVVDFNGWDYVIHQMTSGSNKRFLTSMPDGFLVSPTADIHFNVANLGTTAPFYLRVTNSNGDVFRRSLNPQTTTQIMQVPVGPGNMAGISLVSGSFPVIKSDTTQYTVVITNNLDVAISEERTFVIDHRCDAKDLQLSFVDRQGSVASFSYPLQAIYENEYDKVVYTEGNGNLDASAMKFMYDQSRGGTTTVASVRKEGMTLTTNWIPWAEANYLGELLGSPIVVLRRGGLYYPVEVLTMSQPLQHENKKKLMNRVVQVRYSNLNPINV